jgi:hypothetical protein
MTDHHLAPATQHPRSTTLNLREQTHFLADSLRVSLVALHHIARDCATPEHAQTTSEPRLRTAGPQRHCRRGLRGCRARARYVTLAREI